VTTALLASRQASALVGKDLLLEWRSKEVFSAMLLYVAVVLVIYNFAFEFRSDTIPALAPGVLWSAVIFAGLLGLGRAFAAEADQGTLEGLLLCPVDRGLIFLGKLCANLLFMLLVEALTVPLFVMLFNVSLSVLALIPLLLLGSIGFAVLGTLFAAMAAHTRARELMLPLLLLPLMLPVVIAGVRGTQVLVTAEGSLAVWLNLLAGFDLIFLGVVYALFEYVLEG
jgi:heme exporter protein B